MIKEIIIVKGKKTESYDAFKQRSFELGEFLIEKCRPSGLKICITVQAPPKLAVIPFRKEKISAISMYLDKKPGTEFYETIEGLVGVYQVEEALPVAYEKNWPDGEETPGVCLLTLFKQKKGIDFKTFIDRWHNGHTPLSLKLHPLWNYNRNVVIGIESDGAYPYDGIVEEHFRTKSDLLNPIKFFGNPIVMMYHMWQVYSDTKSFIDYKTMDPYYAAEYFLKS